MIACGVHCIDGRENHLPINSGSRAMRKNSSAFLILNVMNGMLISMRSMWMLLVV